MAEEVTGLVNDIFSSYQNFLSALPLWAQNFINLFLLVIIVVAFTIFIWKFYIFVSRKNFLNFSLNKNNKPGKTFSSKMWESAVYLIENIIIIPFFIFFWFVAFTFFLILMTSDIEMSTLLIISVTVVSAIRMAAYYKEDLAKEIAKLLPFTLLAVAILNPGFFSVDRVFSNFSQLSTFFNEIIIYFLFIVFLEIVLRIFDFIFSTLGFEEEGEEKMID